MFYDLSTQNNVGSFILVKNFHTIQYFLNSVSKAKRNISKFTIVWLSMKSSMIDWYLQFKAVKSSKTHFQ